MLTEVTLWVAAALHFTSVHWGTDECLTTSLQGWVKNCSSNQWSAVELEIQKRCAYFSIWAESASSRTPLPQSYLCIPEGRPDLTVIWSLRSEEDCGRLENILGLPWWLRWWKSACNAGDPGLIPGLGRSTGGGHGYPLQCSCLENSLEVKPLGASPWGEYFTV